MKRMTPSTSANRAFRTGWTIVAVSVGIAAAGWYTLAAEQAQDPRQKDFGVGILAVLFGAPVVILLALGLGFSYTVPTLPPGDDQLPRRGPRQNLKPSQKRSVPNTKDTAVSQTGR